MALCVNQCQLIKYLEVDNVTMQCDTLRGVYTTSPSVIQMYILNFDVHWSVNG